MRYHPVIKFLKKNLKNKLVFNINLNSSSYLPNWRKIDYKKSVSSKRILGGGVLLEMSHELDFLVWIFGKLKKYSTLLIKVSNLKINTDDLLIVNAFNTKKIYSEHECKFFFKNI